MAAPAAERPGLTGHELLLWLAGRIPDRVLADARRMLADGQTAKAVALAAQAIAEHRIPLAADELLAVRELADDPGALPAAQPATELPALPFAFTPAGPHDEDRRDEAEEVEEALVAAAEAHCAGLAGLSRTWRCPTPDSAGDAGDLDGGAAAAARLSIAVGPGSPSGPGGFGEIYPVYIAQAGDPAMIETLSGGLLDAAAGLAGVEVVTIGAELPPYQRAALAGSVPVWPVATAEFTLARVFDFAGAQTGPGFSPGHVVIDDPAARERLLGYLRAGAPVLITNARMDDILDPGAGAAVPGSYRTDGRWIWTDTVVYYLARYGLAPDVLLTAHIEARHARGETVPDADPKTVARAAGFLLNPPAERSRAAVWFPERTQPGEPDGRAT